MAIENSYYKCKNCGKDIGFSDKVCPHCGTITKYGETLADNQKEIIRERKDATGYCRLALLWSWLLVIFIPPIGFFASIAGLVMATMARYRGFWAFILGIVISMALTASGIVLLVLGVTGQLG